jgi:hypothetical protein
LMQPYIERSKETPGTCKILELVDCLNSKSKIGCKARVSLYVKNAKVTTVTKDICEGKCIEVR